MLDDAWIDKLRPEECAAALESLASFGAMTAREATIIHRWQRALKARVWAANGFVVCGEDLLTDRQSETVHRQNGTIFGGESRRGGRIIPLCCPHTTGNLLL